MKNFHKSFQLTSENVDSFLFSPVQILTEVYLNYGCKESFYSSAYNGFSCFFIRYGTSYFALNLSFYISAAYRMLAFQKTMLWAAMFNFLLSTDTENRNQNENIHFNFEIDAFAESDDKFVLEAW